MRPALILAIAIAGFAGCGPDRSVEERVFFCRDLWKDKSALKDPAQLRLALDCYTPATRGIVATLWAQNTSQDTLSYSLDIPKLLDYEEAVGPPEIEKQIAILSLKKKGQDNQRILLELDPVDNEWRIDLLELPRFWAPLALAGSES